MRTFQLILMVFTASIIPMSVAAQAVSTPTAESQATIGGNAYQLLPEGEPGEVSVIAHSIPVDPRDSVGWIIKNNTDQTISDIAVTADLLTPDGKLLGVANKSYFPTEQLNPGEIGIGYSYDAEIADPSVQISFHISYETGPETSPDYADVEIVAAEQTDDRIIGEFINTSEVGLRYVHFSYACFDETEKLLGVGGGSLDGKLAPSERRAFQVMVEMEGCAYFLVSGFGGLEYE